MLIGAQDHADLELLALTEYSRELTLNGFTIVEEVYILLYSARARSSRSC